MPRSIWARCSKDQAGQHNRCARSPFDLGSLCMGSLGDENGTGSRSGCHDETSGHDLSATVDVPRWVGRSRSIRLRAAVRVRPAEWAVASPRVVFVAGAWLAERAHGPESDRCNAPPRLAPPHSRPWAEPATAVPVPKVVGASARSATSGCREWQKGPRHRRVGMESDLRRLRWIRVRREWCVRGSSFSPTPAYRDLPWCSGVRGHGLTPVRKSPAGALPA